MSPRELARIQREVAAICAMLDGLDLDGASALMENVRKTAGAADPVLWAKMKDTHIRMAALMGAALTFKNTVANIRGIVKEERAPLSPIILPH